MRGSYYNEIDPFAAEMLRNLIKAGRKAAYEAKWRADNAAHLKQRAAKRRLEKRAMCLIAGTAPR